jgi:hypothetical protein
LSTPCPGVWTSSRLELPDHVENRAIFNCVAGRLVLVPVRPGILSQVGRAVPAASIQLGLEFFAASEDIVIQPDLPRCARAPPGSEDRGFVLIHREISGGIIEDVRVRGGRWDGELGVYDGFDVIIRVEALLAAANKRAKHSAPWFRGMPAGAEAKPEDPQASVLFEFPQQLRQGLVVRRHDELIRVNEAEPEELPAMIAQTLSIGPALSAGAVSGQE